MEKSVHKNFKTIKNYLLSATAGSKSLLKMAPLFILGVILSLKGMAQTYNTVANGDWGSRSTWSGGVVPSTTIAAGKTVNIKNVVTFSQNSNLVVNGTLNITDTLTYDSKAKKDIQINSTGILSVNGGAIVQDMTANNNDLTINGGKVFFVNANVTIGGAFTATAGATRSYTNSVIKMGQNYSLAGTNAQPSKDSIVNSLVETGVSGSGNNDFQISAYGNLYVANAIVRVDNRGNFKNFAGGNIQVLPKASGAFGFDILKTGQDLQNDGTWNARIDAACIGGNITGWKMADIDFTRAQDCSNGYNPNAPELIFQNPVLKSGRANSEGAVYRFSNVTAGVDAEIKMKNFSTKKIVIQSFDLAGMGWGKAFQPQFGLPGNVAPFQNWYIDFELKFYKAGTNTLTTLPRVDMTALDIDGDGVSITEYAVFQNPSNTIFSNISYLTNQSAGNDGQAFTCPIDSITSTLIPDPVCGGDGRIGLWNLIIDPNCNGTGLLFSACNHGFNGTNGNALQGPVENFNNIDTSSTQVMATYQYTDVNTINFRYGGRSGSKVSNAGIRLNSVWFRDFNLAPPTVLPVKLTNFTAILDRKDVKLSWTGYEENFSHYVVQRSTDGKNYSNVAVVFTNGNKGAYNYTYKDANVSSSTNAVFYRLEMIDNEQEGGNYSDVRVVRLGDKEAEALQITTYPNPVADQVKVILPSAWQGKPVMLQLYTANGTMMQSMQIGGASQTETMQLGQLSKGFYLVKATCGNQAAQQRIIKN